MTSSLVRQKPRRSVRSALPAWLLALVWLLAAATAMAAVSPDSAWRLGTTVHARLYHLPGWLLTPQFDAHTTFHAWSSGAAVLLRAPSDHWQIQAGLEVTRLGFAPGNWRRRGEADLSTAYLEWNLTAFSLEVTVAGRARLAPSVIVTYGAGAGLGYLFGDVFSQDILPNCSPPVSGCGHWLDASKRAIRLPTRWLPVVIVELSVQVRIVGPLWARLEGGLRDALFAGLAADLQF